MRQQLARFYIRSKGLQYTSYRTLTALSRGQTPGPESSIGKLVGAPLRQEMASFAIDLQGAAGAMLDRDDGAARRRRGSRRYLGAPGLRLAGGTDEILRNIIAERVLRPAAGDPRRQGHGVQGRTDGPKEHLMSRC